MENKEHEPGKINILADPSVVTLFSDTVTVFSSGESVRLVFSQKLPFTELDTSGAPTHRIVSSIEVTVPFYMRMLEVANGIAEQIKSGNPQNSDKKNKILN